MSTEIIVAIISMIGGAFVAVVGLVSRKDETANNASETLIKGQSDRIDKLEGRLDTVEAALQATRTELQEIQSHAGDLRDALRRALAWIGEVMEHLADPDGVAPPPVPDVAAWQSLVDSPPKARNPPA
ncbi:hypothetical protein [Corynebacterium coyleae]|uniref:hypothetical protein n=1 Tax=Corynebacterium coyleae TaxID=53374 RepID=UPI00255108AC|nr:hypothetical protein [Corynebacterium coyleae]MDK8242104.1 hypothetical protein [Corynebacterium coyleae]